MESKTASGHVVREIGGGVFSRDCRLLSWKKSGGSAGTASLARRGGNSDFMARRQRDGMCWMMLVGESVKSISDGAKRLQALLMESADMKEGSHRGGCATLARLRPSFCFWTNMEAAVCRNVFDDACTVRTRGAEWSSGGRWTRYARIPRCVTLVAPFVMEYCASK